MMEDDEGDSVDFDRAPLSALPETPNILINQQSAYALNTCVCVYFCVLKLLQLCAYVRGK